MYSIDKVVYWGNMYYRHYTWMTKGKQQDLQQ